ncbi:hypothetical protein [Vibrio phage vB_VmeM-Yong XC32]|nr:hypothetical protein [Vibrio phage vB_VmeM-Yong XC31]QAX96604.1 hypothetical protein [Vibrio phage vB_VmeM-Yong XC32]QAX96922.1 hypothetical protein [Vibrio phage vB_VmeM-Yong MS31]QAX97227.1 hypothetical protein [Vibrio phage vB_VmeM-Yong MS32]
MSLRQHFAQVKQAELDASFDTGEFKTVEEAEAFLQECREENETIRDAAKLIGELTFLKDNSEGATAEMLISSANNILKATPELQLQSFAMESDVELTTEVAMEGIGSVIDTLKAIWNDKLDKAKKKIKKIGQAISMKFKDFDGKLDDITRLVSQGDITEEAVKIPKPKRLYFQADGVPTEVEKALTEWAGMSNRNLTFEAFEEVLAKLKKDKWPDYKSALLSISQAATLYLDRTGQSEADGKKLYSSKNPAYVFYATREGVAGGFQQATVLERKATLSEYYLVLRDVTWYTDNDDVVRKSGVEEIAPLSANELKSVLSNMKRTTLTSTKNWHAAMGMMDDVGRLIMETYSEKTEDMEISKDQHRHLGNISYNLFIQIIYAAQDFFEFQGRLYEAYLDMCKRHVL